MSALGAIGLTSCSADHTSSDYELKPLITTPRPFIEIGVDENPIAIKNALLKHQAIATTNLIELPTDHNSISTPLGTYIATALLAKGTTSVHDHYRNLGLPLDPHSSLRVIAALIGESGQWSTPVGTSANTPDIFPQLDHHCGIFYPAKQHFSPIQIKEWSQYFDQEFYPIDYANPASRKAISQWLTFNTGINIDNVQLPQYTSWICLDTWICSARWQDTLHYHSTSDFYAPSGILTNTKFYSVTKEFSISTHAELLRIALPFDQQLMMYVYMPYDILNMKTTQSSARFSTWLTTVFYSASRKNTLLNFTNDHMRTFELIMPCWNNPTDNSLPLSLHDSAAMLPPGTVLPQFHPDAVLTSISSTCKLSISPGGVGPHYYPNYGTATHASTEDKVILNFPFPYQIVDTTTGMIFIQGFMVNPS